MFGDNFSDLIAYPDGVHGEGQGYRCDEQDAGSYAYTQFQTEGEVGGEVPEVASGKAGQRVADAFHLHQTAVAGKHPAVGGGLEIEADARKEDMAAVSSGFPEGIGGG